MHQSQKVPEQFWHCLTMVPGACRNMPSPGTIVKRCRNSSGTVWPMCQVPEHAVPELFRHFYSTRWRIMSFVLLCAFTWHHSQNSSGTFRPEGTLSVSIAGHFLTYVSGTFNFQPMCQVSVHWAWGSNKSMTYMPGTGTIQITCCLLSFL
jgi:hypothetical protein